MDAYLSLTLHFTITFTNTVSCILHLFDICFLNCYTNTNGNIITIWQIVTFCYFHNHLSSFYINPIFVSYRICVKLCISFLGQWSRNYPWLYLAVKFINGIICFLKMNGREMEKEERWLKMSSQGKDESRRSSPP